MKYLIIVETNLKKPDWTAEYIDKVTPIVESYGGKYLARTPNITKLEGDREPPQFSVVAEFPSKESAESFYNCSEYQPYKKSRQEGSDSNFILIPLEGGHV